MAEKARLVGGATAPAGGAYGAVDDDRRAAGAPDDERDAAAAMPYAEVAGLIARFSACGMVGAVCYSASRWRRAAAEPGAGARRAPPAELCRRRLS